MTVFTWTLVRSYELYPFLIIFRIWEKRNLNIHIPVYMIYYCYYNCIWFVQVCVRCFLQHKVQRVLDPRKKKTMLGLITGPALLNPVLHFEWLGKRATTDIKHVFNLGWYQAVTAITQKRITMGLDIEQQLVENARQSWSLWIL